MAAATVSGVQNRLDDLRKDLSGEYVKWQARKRELETQRGKLQADIAAAGAKLRQRRSLQEEVRRLGEEEARQRGAADEAQRAREEAQLKWAQEKLLQRGEISRLQVQLNAAQAEKLTRVNAASEEVSQARAHNRKLQSDIFVLNQQAVKFGDLFANHTVYFKRRHSGMLTEVAALQKDIHSLQQEVVARAKLQLEIQRNMKRLASQAEEVVSQKQQLVQVRNTCDASLAELDRQILSSQSSFKTASREMASCQQMDARGQTLQVLLNQCRLKSAGGR